MTIARTFNRGIVIAPPIVQKGSGFSVGGGSNSRILRFAALYFDKALFPNNNIIHVGLDSEANELIQRKFAKEHNARFLSLSDGKIEDGRQLASATVEDALCHLAASQRARWSVAYDGMPEIAENMQGAYSSLFLETFSAFPCPKDTVSLEEILAFNAENRKKLHSLRIGISQLAERLTLAKSIPDIANAVSTELYSHLEELDTLLNKSRIARSIEAVSIGIQMPSDAISTILQFLGTPKSVAVAVSNVLSISAGYTPFANRAQSLDWGYILDAKDKKIVDTKSNTSN
jgi:hypothetical protein